MAELDDNLMMALGVDPAKYEAGKKIAQSQQAIVGKSLLATTQSALVTEEKQKNTLDEIRELSLKQFNKLKEAVVTFRELLTLNKNESRLMREQSTEREKENRISKSNTTDDITPKKENESEGRSIFAFLGGLPGAGLIGRGLSKLAGFFKIFAVGGVLGRFLSVTGPIGLIIGGITVLVKYSEEIIAALKPVLESLKKLAPVFEPVFKVLDTLIKFTIKSLGIVLKGLVDDFADLIDGFKNFFTVEGFKKTLFSLFKIIFALPVAIIRTVKEPLGMLWNNISQAWDDGVQSIHDWFSALPGRILAGIRSFFKPVTDFFTTIKIKVREAINSLIETLPIPKFLKKKMKIEPEVSEPAVGKTGYLQSDPGVRVETTREPETVTELVREVTPVIQRTQNLDEPTMLNTQIDEPNMDAVIENYKKTRDSMQALVDKYGFADFMAGDPQYEADLAKSAEQMNATMAGSGDAMMKAYVRFKRMVASNTNRLSQLNMGEFDNRLAPTPDTPKIQISKGVKGVTADLSGTTVPIPPVTIVNQPINQASNASNTSNTVSSTPLKTITDPYFDRESYNGSF